LRIFKEAVHIPGSRLTANGLEGPYFGSPPFESSTRKQMSNCALEERVSKHEEMEFSFLGATGRAVGRVPIFVLAAALVLVAIVVVIFVSSNLI
jgi:hypothetical protein